MTTLASGPASFSTAASTLFDPLAEVPPDTHGSGWVHDIYATELLRDRRAVPEIENTVLSVISEHIRESAGGDLGRFQLDDPAGGLRVWRLSPAPAGDGFAELVERLLAAAAPRAATERRRVASVILSSSSSRGMCGRIRSLCDTAAASGSEYALDDAIDVLADPAIPFAELAELARRMAGDQPIADAVFDWAAWSEDARHILIRAAGFRGDGSFYPLAEWLIRPGEESLHISRVDALANLAEARDDRALALDMLRKTAARSPHRRVREAARAAIEDLGA